MKIGVSSYSYRRFMEKEHADYFAICEHAARTGFDGIEFIDLDPSVQNCESAEVLADDIRKKCAQLGLEIPAYTVHADFLDEEDMVEKLKRKVDIAVRLGAPVMRHDVSWRRDVEWTEMIERTAAGIREVTEYAAKLGVRTCTENHGYVLQDSMRMETLVKTVGHENYGLLVDMGNFLCADEDPLSAVKTAAKYAVHAHAKDFLMKQENPGEGWFPTRDGANLRGTIVGHGVVPVRECVETLKEAGYDGWLSLEFEGMEENLTAIECGYAYLRSLTK